MRIAVFITCFNDTLFPRTGQAMVRVLEALGHELDVPDRQTCCGQIHFNTGYRREARRLAERFVAAFEPFDAVVAPSASCVAMVREQYSVLGDVPGLAGFREAAAELAGRTFEFTEFLTGPLGIEDVGAAFPFTVAYHSTCHSTRGIDVGDRPLRLLEAVDGLELVPIPEAEECCGFGGTFAVKNADTSLVMMADKIEAVRSSGAAVLTAVDNSCLMHLEGGMKRMGVLADDGERPVPGRRMRVMHLAEILASNVEGRA